MGLQQFAGARGLVEGLLDHGRLPHPLALLSADLEGSVDSCMDVGTPNHVARIRRQASGQDQLMPVVGIACEWLRIFLGFEGDLQLDDIRPQLIADEESSCLEPPSFLAPSGVPVSHGFEQESEEDAAEPCDEGIHQAVPWLTGVGWVPLAPVQAATIMADNRRTRRHCVGVCLTPEGSTCPLRLVPLAVDDLLLTI
jgi:hypothetical protein